LVPPTKAAGIESVARSNDGSATGWWRTALWVAFAVGTLVRLNNALLYPTLYGFDVMFNWEYVQRLCVGWELPPPDAGWSFAHPPFFYSLAAVLARGVGCVEPDRGVFVMRLVSTAAGLVAIAATVALVRRIDPGNERRAFLAAGLLLLLPAQIQMSASFGEEVFASAFATGAIALASWSLITPPGSGADLRRGAWVGLLAGLGWLTKLTGVLVVPAVVGAYLLEGLRRHQLLRATRWCVVFVLVAGVVGGWFYARNLVRYGYLYPHDLPVHAEMHMQKPGKRSLVDYVYVPRSTFTRSVSLGPNLRRSVWGGTYVTLWFDGHRHFLPEEGEGVQRVGTAILLLALLPTIAFLIGAGSGIRRTVLRYGEPDPPLLLLVGLTLAGYVLFTWRNPWYSTVKGSYLLGAMLPFAFYASETLARWTAVRGLRSAATWTALAALAISVTLAFSYGLIWAGGGL
jgi:4-amino-4-deoxy-L-arabinose transferase-like glycosyltransferase